jgi:hypothetical protein
MLPFGAAGNVFGGMEFMHWYSKGVSLPPLVTSSPPGTAQAAAGVLPGAEILFGGTDINDDHQTGGRLTFGWYKDACRTMAMGARFYGSEGGTVRFAAGGNGNPIIGRPFFNSDPLVNAEDALLISFPGVASGTVDAIAENDVLGSEVFFRAAVDRGCNYQLDLFAGWQFNRIDSDLGISSQHTQGITRFVFNDLFAVDNEYHAAALGVYAEVYQSNFTISALAKLGIGGMNQQVFITGNNSVTVGANTVVTDGGLLTQPTNMGTFDRSVFTWSPEVNLKLDYAVTPHISLSVGYTFLYWTRAAFAGDQIDRSVNDTQLNGGAVVGPARPAFAFRDTDFWIQSIDLGVNWNF